MSTATTSPTHHLASCTGALLDVDGTLLDTNHLHTLAWWRAFRRAGRTVPMQRINRLIGMGGDQLVSELTGNPDPALESGWSEEFHRLTSEITVLPGARQLVRTLHELGLVVVLASSAPADDVKQFRSVLAVDPWLEGATTSDDAGRSKPHPDIFEVAMERHAMAAETTVVIGDTVWDAQAAERAGCRFVGLETGGNHPKDLLSNGAVAVSADALALTADVVRLPSWFAGSRGCS